MEEKIGNLVANKEEVKELVNENSHEGKHPRPAVVTILPCGTKVKSEPPESDPAVPEVLRVVIDAPEAAVAEAENVKVKDRVSGQEDRFKVQDKVAPMNNNVINVFQKEELENIELNSLGESSLVKLKRRIRLKLLAEEARNSNARKAEFAALEDEISLPNSRIATRNSSDLSSRLNNFLNDEKPVIGQPPSSSGKVRNRIVDLSSESEDGDDIVRNNIPEPPQLVVDKVHPGGGGSSYNDALQRLLGPLLSAVDSKDSKLTDISSSIAAAAAGRPRKPGRPAKKTSGSDLPASRKVPESVSSLVKMLRKGGADEVPLRLRQSKKSLKESKEAAAEIQDSALEYEQERADNIRRNKEFLAQLGLSSTLHSMSARKSNRGRTAGSKNHASAAALYEKHHNVEEILLHNREILERRAATAHALGSKRPRLFDTSDLDDDEEEEDEDEDEDEESEISGGRRLNNQRSKKRMMKNKDMLHEQHSTGSRKLKSNRIMSKATSSSSEKGKSSKDMTDRNPRGGRRRTIPSAVINGLTSSNQELIRFVSELIASASNSLPHTLLGDGGNPDGDDSDQSPRKDNESHHYTSHDDDSPGLCGESGRKRKDTWLTMIPFETPKTEYELERDEILRRHKDQFERLGIVSDLIEEPQPPRPIRPYCRRWASEPDPAYQRNTRFQGRQRKTSMQPEAAALKDNIALTGTRSLLEVHSVSCASSLVAKFTGGCKLDTGHGEKAKMEVTDMEVIGFQPKDGTWLDPDLTRIYTMDLALVSGSSQKNGLLAAGGRQGRLAVFAISDDDGSSTERDTSSKTPLLSWTVDSSWVSQVVFLSNEFQENGTLLLSSSNDGRVVLWDINKQRVRSGTRGLSPLTREGIPVVVCETSTLHSGGIFGMHEFRGKLATSSDGSVAISTIKETGIMVERSIAGHHAGVIRGVRFREQNILADCGVDTVIGILDLRASDPCTLKVQTTHKTGISMIEWSPVCVESNLILSASNDPQLYLHDIRYPAKAMLQLEGHVHPRRVKCYSIYRPTFVAGGDAVVTPGEGTHQLSLYSVTTGTALRKLHVGYDPNILLWNSVIPRQGGVWAGSRGITKFQALWQQRGGAQVQT